MRAHLVKEHFTVCPPFILHGSRCAPRLPNCLRRLRRCNRSRSETHRPPHYLSQEDPRNDRLLKNPVAAADALADKFVRLFLGETYFPIASSDAPSCRSS